MSPMSDVLSLTRSLVDIESVSGNESAIAGYVFEHLSELAAQYDGHAECMPVEDFRFNVFASWGASTVTLSTHLDTVPPFFPSREDDEWIWGRGACDSKGILSAMICAAEALLAKGVRNFGLLFLVGEERNSAGARAAARLPRGSRYLINGEPTDNLLAIASKGALRMEISARGTMVHSAYPELGSSAIDTLLDVLQDIRRIPLPNDPVFGRCTMNIGTLVGGCAPNVLAGSAKAEIMFRLVGDPQPIRDAVHGAVSGRAEIREVLYIPARQFDRLDGIPTIVVAFTTDIPLLAETWGRPCLLGPGSIQVAHTLEERVSKRELQRAVELYSAMVQQLLAPAGREKAGGMSPGNQP